MVRVFTAVLPYGWCPGSPGVVLGGGPVPGEDLVEARQGGFVEVDVERAQAAVELLLGARADDRAGHARAGEQPGERQVAGLVAELLGEGLGRLEGAAVLLQRLRGAPLEPPLALVLLADDSAEQSALQRRPRDDADAV